MLRKLTGSVVDLLFPLTCAACGHEGNVLCGACKNSLAPLSPPYCEVCANPDVAGRCDWCASAPRSIDGIRAPYLMKGPLQPLIHSFKYDNLRSAAGELGRMLAEFYEAQPIPADVLSPVPLHKARERDRGYNQANLIAREVGKSIGMPVEACLVRTKNSPPQARSASLDERTKNVESAFAASGDVSGKRILLIDDVVTTGATFDSCASMLKEAGACSVWGLAVARQGKSSLELYSRSL